MTSLRYRRRGYLSLDIEGVTFFFLLTFLLSTLGTFVGAEEVALVYATRAGAASHDRANAAALDAAGNAHIAGEFHGTVDFDPSAATFNLTGPATRDALFVQKLDPSGGFLWARGVSGTANVRGVAIAVDSLGNVYVAGEFSGTVDFDPGAGTTNLTSNGFSDAFVLKLDASGDFSWARSVGGSDFDFANGIAVDASGNVLAVGSFIGTADFDPGTGTLPLASAGAEDAYVWKLDSAGDLVWARSFGGPGTSFLGDAARAVCVDGNDNIYVTGIFEGTADFDPGPGTANRTSAGGIDLFIVKFDAAGILNWAKAVGGTAHDAAHGIALGAQDSPSVVGYFGNIVDFDPGAGTSPHTASGTDVFILNLDTLGDFAWAQSFGGSANDQGLAIAGDAAGALYTTGYFRGTIDLDPGSGTNDATSLGDRDVFVQKVDSAGDFVWGIGFGGTGGDAGNTLAVSSTGEALVAGQFVSDVDFDPGAVEFILSSASGDDIFVAKYAPLITPAANDDQAATDEDSVLNVNHGGLIYMDRTAGTIATIPRTGGAVSTLVTGVARAEGIAVDLLHGKIYWSVQGDGIIERANIDGSNRETFLTGLGTDLGGGLAVDTLGEKIFWTDADSKRIRVASLDGTGVQDVLTGLNNPYGLAIDPVGDAMFFTESALGEVVRSTLSGGSPSTILGGVAALQTPRGIVLDAGSKRLFVADAGKQDVRVVGTTGTNLVPLTPGIGTTHQVAVDRHLGKLFIALPDAGTIKTADTDSANVQTFLSGVTVGGMALADHPYNLLRNDGHESLSETILVSSFDATSANGAIVSVNANGTFTYDPTASGAVQMLGDGDFLVDTFGYTISDGTLTDTAVVSVTVAGVDDPDPTVQLGAPSLSVTNAGPVSFEASYENTNAVTLSQGDVSLVTTGTATGTIAVSGTGLLSRTIVVSGITGDGTIAISLSAGTASDIEGDPAPAVGPGVAFTVDNTPPVVSISAPSVSATTNGPVTFNVAYVGATTMDLKPDDIVLHATGTATATIGVGSGNTATPVVTLSDIAGDGTLSISIAANSASDEAGNSDPGAGPTAPFVVDNTPPSVSLGVPSTTITQNGPVSYSLVYTGADAVNLTAGDVTLNATGSATGSVSVFNGTTSTPTVTISGIGGEGTLSISVAPGTASDNAGNLAIATGPSQPVEVDNTPPTVSIGLPSASLTRSGPVSFILTVSDADNINVTPADITLNVTGTAAGVISVAGGTTKFPIVTLSMTTGDGFLGINVAGGVATDTLGQMSQPAGPSGTFRVVNYAPIMFIEAPSIGLTRSGPVDFPVTYYGATTISLAASDVGVISTGSATASIIVSGTGTESRTVTLNAISGDGTLEIAIVPGTASNTLGNPEPFGAGPSEQVIVDNTPPALMNLQVTPPAALPNQTVVLTLQFDSDLGEDPEVTVNGNSAFVISKAGPYSFEYTILETDPIGPALITVNAVDIAGNPATFLDSESLTVLSPEESLPLTAVPLAFVLTIAGLATLWRRR